MKNNSRARVKKFRRVGSRGRGFVFTIEAVFAVFLFAIVLATATFLSVQEEKNPYIKLHAERIGSDVLFVLDETGAISSANETSINETLEDALPENFDARLRTSTYYQEQGGFNLAQISEYGSAPANSTNVYEVRRDMVSMGNGRVVNYTIARLEIWQRQ